MTAIPLDYTRNRDRALVGTVADTSHKHLISRHADVELAFGIVALKGAQDRSVKPADGSGGVFIGITVRDQSSSPYYPNAVPAGKEALIMDEGTINVLLADTVTEGEQAAFLDADGGFVSAGTGSSTGILKSRYEHSGVAGEIVAIRLG